MILYHFDVGFALLWVLRNILINVHVTQCVFIRLFRNCVAFNAEIGGASSLAISPDNFLQCHSSIIGSKFAIGQLRHGSKQLFLLTSGPT